MAATDARGLRTLDAVLAEYEFGARYDVAVDADAATADRALREVTFGEVPVVRARLLLRGLGRRRADEPVLAGMRRLATVLEDVPGEGLVLRIRGRFWRLRGGGAEPAATAVVDFRASEGALTTESRVHVPDGVSRRRFERYWRIVGPFSGVTRKQLLRAAKWRAEEQR